MGRRSSFATPRPSGALKPAASQHVLLGALGLPPSRRRSRRPLRIRLLDGFPRGRRSPADWSIMCGGTHVDRPSKTQASAQAPPPHLPFMMARRTAPIHGITRGTRITVGSALYFFLYFRLEKFDYRDIPSSMGVWSVFVTTSIP